MTAPDRQPRPARWYTDAEILDAARHRGPTAVRVALDLLVLLAERHPVELVERDEQ